MGNSAHGHNILALVACLTAVFIPFPTIRHHFAGSYKLIHYTDFNTVAIITVRIMVNKIIYLMY